MSAVAAGRPAVVVLYRGAWCPYCNLTLRADQAQLVPELDRRGIALVPISPQKPDGSLTMQETNDLSFAVLSDPGNQLAGALGVLTAPTPDVALVDRDGTVAWIDVHPDYSTRTEPDEVLRAADTPLR